MVIRAATEGQGIALGWHGLVDDLLESGRLELVFPDVVSTTNGYFLRAARTPPAPAVRRMCDWIVSSAAAK
jgi:DNA-binding transcriptional LysR family regulator